MFHAVKFPNGNISSMKSEFLHFWKGFCKVKSKLLYRTREFTLFSEVHYFILIISEVNYFWYFRNSCISKALLVIYSLLLIYSNPLRLCILVYSAKLNRTSLTKYTICINHLLIVSRARQIWLYILPKYLNNNAKQFAR